MLQCCPWHAHIRMLLQLEQNWPTIKLPFWYGQPPSPDINHVVNFLERDTRNLGDPVVQYIESHSDDVTEVSKPPSSRPLLMSLSFNFTLSGPKFCSQAQPMAWSIFTILPLQTKKKRYIKPLTMVLQFTTPISSMMLISLLCLMMRNSQCMNSSQIQKKGLRKLHRCILEIWERSWEGNMSRILSEDLLVDLSSVWALIGISHQVETENLPYANCAEA